MVKFFCCLVAIALFASCAGISYGGQDNPEKGFSDGDTIAWPKNWPREGFLKPHENHNYGFDISPNYPYVSGKILAKEDSIVYVSIPTGGIGYTTVFTDSGYGANIDNVHYYYCNPDNMADLYLPPIPANISKEHEYRVDRLSIEKVAICKSVYGVTYKINELHKKTYDWKNDYNFYAYIWGDENNHSLRHRLIHNDVFWKGFDTAYSQTIVKHGNVKKKFRSPDFFEVFQNDVLVNDVKKEYFHTRARGIYQSDCAKGEIDILMDSIQFNGGLEGERRVIIQLGYPPRRFWPLRLTGDKIDICGSPFISDSDDDVKFKSTLRLDPIAYQDKSKNDCEPVWDVPVTRDHSKNVWVLDFGGGRKEVANKNNVNPDCAAFVDTATYDIVRYIEEIPIGNAAIAKDKGKATVVVLPWLGNMTRKTAYHELGHTMGLTDVNDAYLSGEITNNSNEGNLMHGTSRAAGFKLRNRGMIPMDNDDCSGISGNCVETQWDCLHKIYGACLKPNLDPYLR